MHGEGVDSVNDLSFPISLLRESVIVSVTVCLSYRGEENTAQSI